MPIRILRAVGVATFVVTAVVALSSCSQPGTEPGGAATSTASAVADPTTSAPAPTETIASDTPAPVVPPVATSAPAGTDTRTAVVPAITTKDWDAAAKALDVSAIVPGVVEGGGTCTVTATAGSTTRTVASTGVAAGSYTGCPVVQIHDLAAGAWQVRVHYSSAKSAGSSKPATVTVG